MKNISKFLLCALLVSGSLSEKFSTKDFEISVEEQDDDIVCDAPLDKLECPKELPIKSKDDSFKEPLKPTISPSESLGKIESKTPQQHKGKVKVSCKLPRRPPGSASTAESKPSSAPAGGIASGASQAVAKPAPVPSVSSVTSAAPAAGSTNTTSSTGASPSTNTNTTSSSAAGSSSNTTSSGAGGDIIPSFDDFKAAVKACGFDEPSQDTYNGFKAGVPKSDITTKRELAMFLAQVLHESGGLKYTAELACKDTGCPGSYDGEGNVRYYGRGYIQLTWKANYAAASQDLYGNDDLVKNPDKVATDLTIAWATGFWFWKKNVHPNADVQAGKFGASTNIINGALECGAPNDKAKKRFDNYSTILKTLKMTDTPDPAGCPK